MRLSLMNEPRGISQNGLEPCPQGELRRASQRLVPLLVETAIDGFCCLDNAGYLLAVNDTYCRMSGYDEATLLRMRISDLEAVEAEAQMAARFERFRSIRDNRFETRHRRKDGTVYEVEASVRFCPEEGGRWFVFLRDITERRARRLESFGQLAEGVAHDLNNIVASTMLHLSFLRQQPGPGPGAEESLNELMGEAERLSNLTRQLLLFSRRSVLDVVPLDLNDVVANVVDRLTHSTEERVHVAFSRHAELPMIEADACRMELVLMNLGTNAVEAMPAGGTLTIELEPVLVDESRVLAHPGVRAGRFVCLSVADTGCGMDASTLSRLFEPFFSTKKPRKGAGMGLATVYGVVGQHGGWVEVDSRLGQGTTFRVFLPVAPEPLMKPANTYEAPDLRGTETILLVEGDPSARRSAAQSLRLLGYAVFEDSTGAEAIRTWRGSTQPIDLLLTDLELPGDITGMDLARQLCEQQPSLKVVITSSAASAPADPVFSPGAPMVRLRKPCPLGTLAGAIRDLLERPS